MVARNRNAVARLPMRLMLDGSRGQGGPPGRSCDAIKVARSVGEKMAKSGLISTAAVDQVYEVRNHPLLDVLDNPDPYGNFTRDKLIGLMVSYCDVVGSAYLIPEGNGWQWQDRTPRAKGPPSFLWVVYPQYIIPIRQGDSPIVDNFQYFSDNIPLESALWFRHNHSLRDPYGAAFSPTYAGEPYRRQEQEFNALFSQVMGIGPRPNMIASAKDPLMPPGKHEAEALALDLVRKQGGGYAGGVLINTGAWDYTPVSYSPADLAGKELSEYDIYMLAAIFDQPATYYTVESNLANLQAADLQHDKMGVQPRCKTIAGVFTRLAKQCDPRLSFQFDSGLPEDDLVKAQVDKIYVDMGAITLNQLNEERKYPKQDWGDQPWLPATLKQPDMIREAHDQAIKQGDQAIKSRGQSDELAAKGHELSEEAQEHGQRMDREKLEIEKKAGSEPVAAQSLEDKIARVIGEIRDELDSIDRGNPNHVPSGPHGGEFTSGSGSGGAAAAHAPGKHHEKNQRKKAKKKLQKPAKEVTGKPETAESGDKPAAHAPGSKAALDRAKKGKPAAYKSDKAELAAKNAKPTTKEVQDYTKQNEYTWADRLKHKYKDAEAFPDNGPVDVQLTIRGRTRGIEMKTLVQGENDKVTMSGTKKGNEKESALQRKVNWQEEHGAVVDTIVDDHRNRYKGGEHKHLYSGGTDAEAIYYKRGTGSFRINAMYRVKDQAELERLLETPYHLLPKKAQGDRRGDYDESYLEPKK